MGMPHSDENGDEDRTRIFKQRIHDNVPALRLSSTVRWRVPKDVHDHEHIAFEVVDAICWHALTRQSTDKPKGDFPARSIVRPSVRLTS